MKIRNLQKNYLMRLNIKERFNMDFKTRLLEETRELAIKLNKLNEFMASDKFIELDRENKDLLYEQQRTMSTYLQILGKRLELLGIEFTH